MTDNWELHRRFFRFYFLGIWPCFLLLITGSFVGGLLGAGYSGIPAKFRIYWLGPLILGMLAGLATGQLAGKFQVRSKFWIAVIGVCAGANVFGAYAHQSLNKFELMAAIESEDSKAARLFLQRIEAGDKNESPLSDRNRWVTWRSKPFGPPPAPWPHVIFFSELAVASIAGGIAATRSRPGVADGHKSVENTDRPTAPEGA